jgi:hypothetical protein
MKVRRWWYTLCVVAACNVAAWTVAALSGGAHADPAQLVLSALYVFGCAFRSVFPVYDIPRLCVVNPRASSVLIGRSIATVAELAFAAQWAVYLHGSQLDMVRGVSLTIVPLIAIAEICSWHAVLTTKNLGHVFENSLWGIAAALIVFAIATMIARGGDGHEPMLFVWAAGGVLYVAYIFVVDVPMYWSRWKSDEAEGKRYLDIAQGLGELSRTSRVSWRWEDWKSEVTWMTLYFTIGVWVSISLIFAGGE